MTNLNQDQTDSLPQRSLRALSAVDEMPADLRSCVHEFGYAIVNAFVLAKVTSPAQIRRLVQECWDGARQPHQRSFGRLKSPVENKLDWLLTQSGSSLSAATFIRTLYTNNMIIIQTEPSEYMVQASIDAVKFMDKVTKQQKHRNRLRDAIRASTMRLWPFLFEAR